MSEETVIKCGVPGGISCLPGSAAVQHLFLLCFVVTLQPLSGLLCSSYSNSHISPGDPSDLLGQCLFSYLDVPVEKTRVFPVI